MPALRHHALPLLLFLLLLGSACRSRKPAAPAKTGAPAELRDLRIARDLKQEVERWLGTPYRYGGCTRNGTDCSGFVQAIYRDVYEISLPRTSRAMFEACRKVKAGDLREGDLVFFSENGKSITHVGIYLDNGQYVHASSSKGVVLSPLNGTWSRKYWSGATRCR